MQYEQIEPGYFLKRPNRFIAHVMREEREEVVHVKNTGRCKEILVPGTTVYLEKAKNKNRKTNYSLVSAYKGENLINIDSLAPNQVVYEGLHENKVDLYQNLSLIKREVTYKQSRFDIYFEKGDQCGFIEVKGVTLEKDGVAMFPDAPTERGTKHVYEMIDSVKQGYLGCIFFLIQLKGVKQFTPNSIMDPKFSEALSSAYAQGVKIVAYDCEVTPRSIILSKKIKVVIK